LHWKFIIKIYTAEHVKEVKWYEVCLQGIWDFGNGSGSPFLGDLATDPETPSPSLPLGKQSKCSTRNGVTKTK